MVIQLIITDEHLITYTTVNMNQNDQNMEEHKCQHKHRKEDENDGKANCEATTKKLFPWIAGHFLGEGSIPAFRNHWRPRPIRFWSVRIDRRTFIRQTPHTLRLFAIPLSLPALWLVDLAHWSEIHKEGGGADALQISFCKIVHLLECPSSYMTTFTNCPLLIPLQSGSYPIEGRALSILGRGHKYWWEILTDPTISHNFTQFHARPTSDPHHTNFRPISNPTSCGSELGWKWIGLNICKNYGRLCKIV